MSLAQEVKELAQLMGFQAVGVTSASPLRERGDAALARVRDGLMEGLPWFTQSRVRLASDPQRLLPQARSIISLAISYLPSPSSGHGPEEDGEHPGMALRGRVARYAQGSQDYHGVLKPRLKALVKAIEARVSRPVKARIFVDDSPLLERAAAERAGVGWFGKSTNIIVPSVGSWVLLAHIILDLELEEDTPLRKTCGNCTLCMDRCPTGAIVAPYVLDNRRCISYLTIECRGSIPRELRPLVGDWVFGCDICQEVCPVNRKAVPTTEPAFQPFDWLRTQPGEHGYSALELLPLLELTPEGFRQRFRHTAIWRATYTGLLRNICVALGNIADPAAVPALSKALAHPEALVREHAAWALERI